MKNHQGLLNTALIAFLLTVRPAFGTADTSHSSDPYFALDRVLDVSIEIAPEDWDRLRGQTRTLADILVGADCLDSPADDIFTWFEATVTVDGEILTQVGVRKKGFLGSLSKVKPALKVRFDKFVDGQLLGGAMKRLTLNNAQQDPSLINTCMAYHIFASAGLPAPRCNFATVAVNGENLGLYVHVESMKTAFLERNFSDPSGNLYEGTVSDFRPKWRGTLQKTPNAAAADWSDIDAVVTALQDPSPAGLEALADIIDIDRFLTFWATEVLIGHWDGYAGNRNNFYVYREPDAPFVVIPWGADQVFTSTDGPFDDFVSPPSITAHGAIAHRLYRDDGMRAVYVARLKQLLDTVWNEEELLDLADEMAAIVQQHGLVKRRAYAASDTDRVRQFIRERRAVILADLDPEPAAWPWPLASADICWPERGAFDLRFETTWGSSESENPLGEGTVAFSDYQLGGKEQDFNLSGAIAGFEEDDGRTNKNRASLSIISLGKDFAIDVLTVSLPIDWVESGANLPIDMKAVTAYRVSLPSPDSFPDQFELIAKGGIEFSEASTEPGAKISGRFYGTLFSFGGGEDTASEAGDAEAGTEFGLVINEVAAQGDPLDWFELYNASDESIDLADFVMADDLTDESKRTPFPDGTVIEAGAYLQIELDKDGWPGFALGRDEELGIWTADGILVAQIDWEKGQADERTSWARLPDITGDFQTVDTPTPGAPNEISTAIAEQTAGVPEAFWLHGNWPNPFNASTTIAFDVSGTVPVHLVVYDVLGRRVRILHSGETLTAGHYRTSWNGRDDEGRSAASGVYLYQLTAGKDFTAVGRMALVR
ncbi:MAG: T9SS type A sorting domain-containing protein [Gemmatimonadetes bacterium]|nr:T9SS type A sorting domain-containing protein [Gemmatimonadota bacterium]